MTRKSTYEELEQRVKELEEETLDLKQVERDLTTFKAAIESSINAIGITDLEGKLIYVNDSSVKMWGYNGKDEILGRFLPEFWEGDGVFKTIKELREKGVASGEDIGKRKDGSLFFVQFTASIFKNEAGNPSFMFGSFFDITARKQAEEALRESEKLYHAVVDSQTEMICRFLQDGTLTFVNEAYCSYFDKSRKELIGQNFMFLIPEDDREKVSKNILSLNQNNPVMTHEHRVISPNGDISWHRWTNRAIFDDQNKLLEFQSVGWDITERVRIEKTLMESEKRYKSLFKDNHSVMLLIDPENGDIVDANPAAVSFYGWSYEELICKKITNINMFTEKKVFQEMKKAKEEQRQHFYFQHYLSNGNIRDVEVFSGPIKIQGRELLYSIIHDITKRKQAELSLTKKRKELQNKSHELEEVNAALKVLLKNRDEDKKDLENKIVANLKKIVFPYVEKLYNSQLNERQMVYLNIIKSNLVDIIAPFLHQLSSKYSDLTPSEIQVAGLVKDGKTTKEIAELLNSSTDAIDFHRHNLRKKLGLRKTKTNLRSFLLSFT